MSTSIGKHQKSNNVRKRLNFVKSFLVEVLFRKENKDVVNNYAACFCPRYFTFSFLSRICRMKIAARFMAKTQATSLIRTIKYNNYHCKSCSSKFSYIGLYLS